MKSIRFFLLLVTWTLLSLSVNADELVLYDPNGGEILPIGITYPITWTSVGSIEHVQIEFSDDNGDSWNPVATVPNTGSSNWLVPSEPSGLCLIQITDPNNPAIQDVSDATFRIYQCPQEIAMDFNNDCYVDLADFALFSEEWLLCANPYDLSCPCTGFYADCDGDPDNGCETNTGIDPANCGSCANVCDFLNAVEACVDGQCVIDDCEDNFGDCDGNPLNGCEVDLTTDTDNCGLCGNTCDAPHSTMACVDGFCEIVSCDQGYDDCNGGPSNGCETNTDADSNNCGNCGVSCSAPMANTTCQNGTCVIVSCYSNFYDCDGIFSNGCEGTANDSYEPNNSCSISRNLGTVEEYQSERSWQAQILPEGDEDWFQFYAEEGTKTCFPGTDQDYQIRVRLVPPQGASCRDYDLYLYDDSCQQQLGSSMNSNCSEEVINYIWDGECGFGDSRYFRVQINGWSSAWECAPYTLYIDMWEL